MNKEKILALLGSYARSVLSAALALYLARVALPDIAWSLVSAIIPVVIRYINPNDVAFGRVPTETEVNTALTNVKVVKAPAKKSAPKTTAKK
jgi:hypothetical protein